MSCASSRRQYIISESGDGIHEVVTGYSCENGGLWDSRVDDARQNEILLCKVLGCFDGGRRGFLVHGRILLGRIGRGGRVSRIGLEREAEGAVRDVFDLESRSDSEGESVEEEEVAVQRPVDVGYPRRLRSLIDVFLDLSDFERPGASGEKVDDEGWETEEGESLCGGGVSIDATCGVVVRARGGW